MLSPHIPIFPKPASQSNQCKRQRASSMVARPNSRRSLTHKSFDPRCSNGRLFPQKGLQKVDGHQNKRNIYSKKTEKQNTYSVELIVTTSQAPQLLYFPSVMDHQDAIFAQKYDLQYLKMENQKIRTRQCKGRVGQENDIISSAFKTVLDMYDKPKNLGHFFSF